MKTLNVTPITNDNYHLFRYGIFTDIHGTNYIEFTGFRNNSKPSGHITIPSRVRGRTVAKIGNNAFANASDLTSVVLPNTVREIGVSAFSGTGIANLTIPHSVTYIGNSAFANTADLQTVIFTSNGQLQRIGENVFYGAGFTSITIPANIVHIADSAFRNASSLRSITFAPNSQLRTIGENAFRNSNINSTFRIPDRVHTVGANAFTNTPLYINSGTAVIRAGNWVVGLRANSIGSMHNITHGIVGIADNALADLGSRLQTVTLPSSFRYIGANAFRGSEIREIIIPSSVVVIRDAAFFNSRRLEKMYVRRTIADGFITHLGNDAFRGVSSNLRISVPECSYLTYINSMQGWQQVRHNIYLGPLVINADRDNPHYINTNIDINQMRTFRVPVHFANDTGATQMQVFVEFVSSTATLLVVGGMQVNGTQGASGSFVATTNRAYSFDFMIFGFAEIRLRVRAERMPSEPQLLGHGSGTSIHFDINYDDLIGYAVRVLHDLTVPAHQTNAHIWLYYTNFSQSNFSIVATPTRSLRFSWNSTKQD